MYPRKLDIFQQCWGVKLQTRPRIRSRCRSEHESKPHSRSANLRTPHSRSHSCIQSRSQANMKPTRRQMKMPTGRPINRPTVSAPGATESHCRSKTRRCTLRSESRQKTLSGDDGREAGRRKQFTSLLKSMFPVPHSRIASIPHQSRIIQLHLLVHT